MSSSQDVHDNQGPLLVDEEGDEEDIVNPINTMNEINAFDGQEDEASNSIQDAEEVSEI